MIYFWSDTHFLHENIIKFDDEYGARIRHEYETLEQMHESFIANANSVVMQQDKFYFLGDVSMKYGDRLASIMTRINGKKRLTLGNHDKIKGTNLADFFQKVELWKGFKEYDFVATHIPLRPDGFRGGVRFNVHGHLHANKVLLPDGTPDPRYICVCVEQVGYTPVSLDWILATIKERSKQVDYLNAVESQRRHLARAAEERKKYQ